MLDLDTVPWYVKVRTAVVRLLGRREGRYSFMLVKVDGDASGRRDMRRRRRRGGVGGEGRGMAISS